MNKFSTRVHAVVATGIIKTFERDELLAPSPPSGERDGVRGHLHWMFGVRCSMFDVLYFLSRQIFNP
jgi:hypothetical protein